MREIKYMCPHCGWVFHAEWLKNDLVPGHDHADGSGRYPFSCPGSAQVPRNPESDKRPLWKDLPKETSV